MATDMAIVLGSAGMANTFTLMLGCLIILIANSGGRGGPKPGR